MFPYQSEIFPYPITLFKDFWMNDLAQGWSGRTACCDAWWVKMSFAAGPHASPGDRSPSWTRAFTLYWVTIGRSVIWGRRGASWTNQSIRAEDWQLDDGGRLLEKWGQYFKFPLLPRMIWFNVCYTIICILKWKLFLPFQLIEKKNISMFLNQKPLQ